MAALKFSYRPEGSKQAATFAVPPLTETQLISTSTLQGAADEAALAVIPINKSVCSEVNTYITPDSYDFRQEYWEYTSPIINQGTCGSCWAISSTQALSSRVAFFSNQKVIQLSAAYMLYCTRFSFSRQTQVEFGCTGGSLVDAYWFFNVNGTVAADCLAYDTLGTWEPSQPELQRREVSVQNVPTKVSCPMTKCPGATGTEQPWLYKTSISYIVAGTAKQGGSERNIRQEIWHKGPVSTGFEVRQDFIDFWKQMLEGKLSGKALIYTPGPVSSTNPLQGNHAVQLLGWGEMEGTDYWICANSWGATNTDSSPAALQDYGNNGYFLMVRGENACALESNVVAGVPRVHPNTVGASGKSLQEVALTMCDLVAFEINDETLALLKYERPSSLPDPHTIYDYTVPPIYPTNVGNVRQFTDCPADRPQRCPLSGVCVPRLRQCGASAPTQGKLTYSVGGVDKDLAAGRNIKQKYIVQQLYERELKKPNKKEMFLAYNKAQSKQNVQRADEELKQVRGQILIGLTTGFTVLIVVFIIIVISIYLFIPPWKRRVKG